MWSFANVTGEKDQATELLEQLQPFFVRLWNDIHMDFTVTPWLYHGKRRILDFNEKVKHFLTSFYSKV